MAMEASGTETGEMLKALLKVVKGTKDFVADKNCPMGPKGNSNNKKSIVAHLDSLRRDGNRFFRESNYITAMNLYSQCIVQSGETMESLDAFWKTEEERNLKAAKLRKILFIALCNRAETWLRLKDYRQALRDAERALESDPNHAKCLVRKGKSLEGLQKYEEACSCFQSALKQVPDDTGVQNSLRRSMTCYRQCFEGDYEAIFDLSNCGGERLDPCCEFVGPVTIQKREGGGFDGRGVFLTRSVSAGDLLLVSNALAVVGGDPKEKHPIQSLEDYWISRADCSLTEANDDLALHLAFCAEGDSELRAKLCVLFAGSQDSDSETIPGMELFKPGAEWCPGRQPVVGPLQSKLNAHKAMIARMRKVVQCNAYTDFDEWGRAYSGCRGREEYLKAGCGGVWLLPSFINHSCAPNCTKVYIGKSMFVRACRAMEPGEELFLAYCDVSLGVEYRCNRLQMWGFDCYCSRCLAETTHATAS